MTKKLSVGKLSFYLTDALLRIDKEGDGKDVAQAFLVMA